MLIHWGESFHNVYMYQITLYTLSASYNFICQLYFNQAENKKHRERKVFLHFLEISINRIKILKSHSFSKIFIEPSDLVGKQKITIMVTFGTYKHQFMRKTKRINILYADYELGFSCFFFHVTAYIC